MATKKIRICDICEKTVDPYSFGSITLFNEIRIGRGGIYKVYSSDSPCFKQKIESHNDYDSFGYEGFDKKHELTFCSLKCCGLWIDKAFSDMFEENLEGIKKKSFDADKLTLDEYKKLGKQSWLKSFFKNIKAKDLYKRKIQEFDNLMIDLKEKKKDYQRKLERTPVGKGNIN